MNNTNNKSIFSNNFGRNILRNLFSLNEGIKFKFKFKKNKLEEPVIKHTKIKLSKFFTDISSEIENMFKLYSEIDDKNWAIISMMTTLYKKSLPVYLSENYNIHTNDNTVSRAWIKMYEILTLIPEIIQYNKPKIKSFHMCELPGNFISSIEYFVKTKRKSELDWKAQSLNAKHKINIKKYGDIILDDTFDLFKNNPKKWIWGKDNTGDITNPDNIKFYKKYCKNVDIITSDCGLAESAVKEHIDKVNYCQFLFIFNNLPENSNCILKVFNPLTVQKISLLYLMFNKFRKLYFYKPMQNPGSVEFYVIGINYYDPLNKDELKILFKLLDKYDKNISVVENISKRFILQLEKITRLFIDNLINEVKTKKYYADNLSKIVTDNKKYIYMFKNIIAEKNIEWAREMKIVANNKN